MARRLLLLLVLCAATLAVASGPVAAQEPPNPPDPYIVGGDAQQALDKARAKWKSAKIGSYRYEARRTCFCPTSGWHVVNVRKGVPSKQVHSDVKDIATVPRLFRQVQRAIDAKAHDLTVTYASHGVPAKISIDTYENVIDEEQYFTIRGFKRR
jgi:hypothetical protein